MKDFSCKVYTTLFGRKIYFLNFTSHKKMIKALLRPQMFCESIKWYNKLATFTQYAKWFKKEFNEEPGQDWAGCSVTRFGFWPFHIRSWRPSPEEKAVWDLVKEDYLKFEESGFGYKPFYVLATYRKDMSKTYRHEISHAMYALDYIYQDRVNKIVGGLHTEIKERMGAMLKKHDYARFRYSDEIHAYLMDGIKYWEYITDKGSDERIPQKLRYLFKDAGRRLRIIYNFHRELNGIPRKFK